MRGALAIGTRCVFRQPSIARLNGQLCRITASAFCELWPYIVEFEDRSHIVAFRGELEPITDPQPAPVGTPRGER